MSLITNLNWDYSGPIRVAKDVYWVGTFDEDTNAHSNSYLIVDGDEALLIDGGSRAAFPSVMMKILQTGIVPSAIMGLVCQNYNPRFCGSIPHMEVIIGRQDLKIISDQANHMFIQHYTESGQLFSLEDINHQLRFKSGRTLNFVNTPFAHSAGNFVTFDPQSRILFTGDLFSSYTSHSQWDLLFNLQSTCHTCTDFSACPLEGNTGNDCPIHDILQFHRQIMPSERALKYAIEQIAQIPFLVVAPQHGSIIHEVEDIMLMCQLLASLKGVGIDSLIGERSFLGLGDVSPIKERLQNQNS